MDQLLNFIEHLCIDERLYWLIPSEDESQAFEVMWQRQNRPFSWSCRRKGDEQWTTLSAAEFLRTARELKLDMAHLERSLGASVLTQAVFADMVLEGAVRIFGQNSVNRSIQDTKNFLSSVSDAAVRMAGQGQERKAPRLHIVPMQKIQIH